MNVPTHQWWPRCTVRTYNSSHADGLGATYARDCIYGNCTFKIRLSCSWNWSISVTKGLTVLKNNVITETCWHAYSKTFHQRGFDFKREKKIIHIVTFRTQIKKGIIITFNYIAVTHSSALTRLSFSTHYMFIRAYNYIVFLAFHDHVPISPLIPYNTKFGQHVFAERAAFGEHIPRIGRGFRASKATQYKQQDVCWNDAIFQLRKVSWKCGSILTNT